MNGNRQMEVHYIDTGFPYTITQSFMDLFEGLTYVQTDSAFAGALYDEGNSYWSLSHMNAYKYEYSAPISNSYYLTQSHEMNNHAPELGVITMVCDNQASVDNEVVTGVHTNENGTTGGGASVGIEECVRGYHDASSQVLWQHNFDPDNMTYEGNLNNNALIYELFDQELLDLGETVGTQSRGLSKELISHLPISKYKYNFFSRKKFRHERCVICQMNYKRGDRQMTLPCKHVYHASCVSRWLGINKACPVCFVDVFGDKARR